MYTILFAISGFSASMIYGINIPDGLFNQFITIIIATPIVTLAAGTIGHFVDKNRLEKKAEIIIEKLKTNNRFEAGRYSMSANSRQVIALSENEALLALNEEKKEGWISDIIPLSEIKEVKTDKKEISAGSSKIKKTGFATFTQEEPIKFTNHFLVIYSKSKVFPSFRICFSSQRDADDWYAILKPE